MKVAFHTLGCKVNSYESQAMLNMFEEAGGAFADGRLRYCSIYRAGRCLCC